jgi:hypothetical protein
MTEPATIFLHIPKTAGVTLYHVIERQYRPEDMHRIVGTPWGFEDFTKLSQARRAEIRLLTGHIQFGVHLQLPRPAVYFTLLREPVDRVISYFEYIRRRPEDYFYDLVASNNLDLKGFIQSKADVMMDNHQTRILAGCWYDLEFGECTEAELEAAKTNLREHFAVVGLTERFDETLLLLKRAFGWRNVFYTRANVAPRRLKRSDLPPDTLDVIAQVNWLDVELYRYATALFEERVHQLGPAFTREVERFQTANRRLQPVLRAYQAVRQVSVREFVRKGIGGTFTGQGPD